MFEQLTKNRATLLWLLSISVVVILLYWGLSQTFYQQDEWQEIGLLRSHVIDLNPFAAANGWHLLIGQGRFFSDLMLSGLVLGFPFQMWPFAVSAIVLHLFNVYLVYRLADRLSGSTIVAYVAASFFALNAVASQAVIWMGAIATLPATSLILASIFCYLQWLDTKRIQWFVWSFAALFLSLLFKEVGLFLVLLYPLYYHYHSRTDWRQTIKANLIFLGYGLVVALLRVVSMASASTAKNGTMISGGHDFIGKVIVHTVLYPLTGIYQTVIPSNLSYLLAKKLSYLQYPFVVHSTMADIVPQTIITDLVAVIGTLLIVGLTWLIVRRQAEGHQRLWLLAIASAALSFLPYIVLDRGGSYMDSRYYYVAAIGLAFLVGLAFDRLWHLGRLSKITVILLLSLLLGVHLSATHAELQRQKTLSQQRRLILNDIKTAVPTLSEKNVFYITGDKSYEAPNNHVPFQQGLGYTLMVWYGDNQFIPSALLADKFLWDLGTEGYREVDGYGFGFFSQPEKLQQAISQYGLTADMVHAFYWDSQQATLIEMTDVAH